jgi:nicotinamidase-related amidase
MLIRMLSVALLAALVMFAAAGYAEAEQATAPKTALIIIDVQDFYFPGGALPLENPEAASLNCKKLLDRFRADGEMIVHVGHKVREGGGFYTDVVPREGEKVVMKSEVSAFNGTELTAYLRENDVTRLVICGMQTHMCVEGAVRAAYDLGFEVVLVGDACATRTLKFGDKTVAGSDVHTSTLATLDGTYATVVDTETLLKTRQDSPR